MRFSSKRGSLGLRGFLNLGASVVVLGAAIMQAQSPAGFQKAVSDAYAKYRGLAKARTPITFRHSPRSIPTFSASRW